MLFRTVPNLFVSTVLAASLAACATPQGDAVAEADASLSRAVVDGVTCVDLIAGKHIVAGEVCVEVVDDALAVTYTTVNGWLLDEVHLWVGGDLAEMPVNNNGVPVPGHFPYAGAGLATDSYTILVPLDTSVGICTEDLIVAAHAAVSKGAANETAWGKGEQFGGPRWGSTVVVSLIDDADEDSVCDPQDVCEGSDDLADADADAVPDGCDVCAGHDDAVDTDTDGTPDGCELPEEPPVEPPTDTGTPGDEWPSESGCETAFGFGATELDGLPGFPLRWGWSIGPVAAPALGDAPEVQVTPIYAGAGQNVLTNGTWVGDLTVTYDGAEITVAWDLFDGNALEVTHLYVGATQPVSSAPGSFGNTHDLDGASSDAFTVGGFAGESLYVVAHAEVCL